MKDFQPRGLLGERHAHKTILMLPLPAFSANNPLQSDIVKVSKRCAAIAAKAARKIAGQLDPRALGRQRSSIRACLATQMDELDALFDKLLIGPPTNEPKPGPKPGRTKSGADLFSA
jgi:hypothetical protein